MTTRKYSSRSQQTTLASALTSSGTSAIVVSGSALMGGATVSTGETYTVVIDPDTALEEIVDVTSVSTNTLTIVRGVETGGVGQAHSAGAAVRHMATGRDFREANQHNESGVGSSVSTTAHGVDFDTVITTTNTKTLTNKTLTSPTITSPTITGTGAIAGTFTGNLTGNVTGNVSGNAGTVTNGIYNTDTGTVTSAMIANGTIVDADINTSAAITATKIAGTAVTQADTGTVTSTMIANNTIIDADINSSAAIAATKISGTAVTQADTGTVTSTMIANGTIVDADIASGAAITKTKLNLGGTITSADLVDGTIVASDIADGTITAAKMVSDPYARANHTGSQAASTISDFDTQVRTSRLDQMAAPTGSVSLNSQKITSLATPTTNTDAATKAYVDTKVADLVNSAPSTLDTLGEIATAISAGGSVVSALVSKAGDTMTGPLTLSGAPSNNLHAATKAYVDSVAGSTAAAEAAAAAAAASYDSFDDRYLGAKSTAPSVDNDGNALIEGAIYWNSVDNAMYAWTGTEWGSISSTAEIYRFRFTASGGETTISGLDDNGLTLSYLPGKEQVYLNGILLVRTTDYTASSGSSLTSLAALTAGDIVEIITFTSFEVADAIARSVFDAKGDILVGTAADTVGKLPVGTSGQFLKADSTTATGLAWGEVAGALAQPSEPSSPSDGQIWIDTDGTVGSGTQITRWYKAPTAGTTTLTGPGDNSVTLQYTAGYEQVYLNGVLLVRGTDYTATDGGTVELTSATVTGDTVEVIGVVAVGVTDVYTQSQSDAKYIAKNLTTTTGDIIYASAANTPARLGIGSSGQVLGVSGGVPAWQAAPSSALALSTIATGTFSGTTVNITGLTQDFIQIILTNPTWSTGVTQPILTINNSTSSSYYYLNANYRDSSIGTNLNPTTKFYFDISHNSHPTDGGFYTITLQNAKSSGFTSFRGLSSFYGGSTPETTFQEGHFAESTPVTSIQFSNAAGYTFTGGTYRIIGA